MSKTTRWYYLFNKFYNTYWFKHELKSIRIKLHRKFRHKNKLNIKRGLDTEVESKTNGWKTY